MRPFARLSAGKAALYDAVVEQMLNDRPGEATRQAIAEATQLTIDTVMCMAGWMSDLCSPSPRTSKTQRQPTIQEEEVHGWQTVLNDIGHNRPRKMALGSWHEALQGGDEEMAKWLTKAGTQPLAQYPTGDDDKARELLDFRASTSTLHHKCSADEEQRRRKEIGIREKVHENRLRNGKRSPGDAER